MPVFIVIVSFGSCVMYMYSPQGTQEAVGLLSPEANNDDEDEEEDADENKEQEEEDHSQPEGHHHRHKSSSHHKKQAPTSLDMKDVNTESKNVAPRILSV